MLLAVRFFSETSKLMPIAHFAGGNRTETLIETK